jgi:hypothetical protein
VRLRDLFTGDLTYLELSDYLDHLPPESAFQTELRDTLTDEELAALADKSDKHGVWSKESMLLAAVFDSINFLTHVQITKAGVDQDPPEPLSRPGVVSKQKQAISPQAQAYLLRIRELHAQQQTEVES